MYKDLNEKDACGVGFVANRFGSRSHEIIKMATQAVTNLTHRGRGGGGTQRQATGQVS